VKEKALKRGKDWKRGFRNPGDKKKSKFKLFPWEGGEVSIKEGGGERKTPERAEQVRGVGRGEMIKKGEARVGHTCPKVS